MYDARQRVRRAAAVPALSAGARWLVDIDWDTLPDSHVSHHHVDIGRQWPKSAD